MSEASPRLAVESSGARRALVAAVCAAAAALAVVQWRIGVQLSNDGPQRLYAALVQARYDDPSFGVAGFWLLNPSLTSHGFAELVRVGLLFGPWDLAYRAALVCVVELVALAAFAMVMRGDARRGWLALLAFPAALSWSFYLGFVHFLLGSALGLLLCAWFDARARGGWRSVVLLSVGALAVSVLHVLAALFAIAACGVLALRGRVRTAARVSLSLIPVALVLLAVSSDFSGQGAPWHWLPWHERAAQLVTHFVPGPWWRSGVAVLALAGGAWAVVRSPSTRPYAFIGLSFFAGSLVLPYGGSWDLVSPRALPWAFVFLLAAVPVERASARARVVTACAMVAWCAAAFAWSWSFHGALRAQSERLLAPLVAGPGKEVAVVRTPLVLVRDAFWPQVPALDPALHVGQVLGAAWGGFMHYSHTGLSTGHQLAPTSALEAEHAIPPAAELIFQARRATDAHDRRALVDAIAAQAAALDEVIVLGAEADLDAFFARGFIARARAPGWFVGAAPRCDVALSVSGLAAATEVAVGVDGARAPNRRFDVNAGSHTQRLSLPCGGLWMSVAGVRCASTGSERVGALARAGEPNVLACDVAP